VTIISGIPGLARTMPAQPHPSHRPLRVGATKHEQRDATVLGDLRLRYVDVRPAVEVGPPVVLLHGLASRIEEYEDLIDSLRVRRRVVVMDLPGNGYSDKPERAYTLRFLEDAVLALLDRLAIGNADLAGGSLGGNLALRLAHRAPERFRRLVPWAPAGAWEPKPSLALMFASARHAGSVLFWPFIWVQSRFWHQRAWRGRQRALVDAFQHFHEVHGRPFVRMYFDLCREQLMTSLFPIAPEIAHPTVVLWGDEDRGLGMDEGVQRLVGLMPRSRLAVIPGAGHALAAEAPGPLALVVDAFLRS
jgi:2-hydroxy-6-oxonona-2,4-dienedioate hydrolase